VHAQQGASLFWLSQGSRNQLGKEKHKVHHVVNEMLWPCTTSAHTTRCRGAVRKNIISDRFSTKTAISVHI